MPHLLRVLIDAGLDLEQHDNNLETALFWAVKAHDINCLEMLLEAGANVEGNKNCHHGPLLEAVQRQNTEFASLLCNYDANPFSSGCDISSPIKMVQVQCRQKFAGAWENVMDAMKKTSAFKRYLQQKQRQVVVSKKRSPDVESAMMKYAGTYSNAINHPKNQPTDGSTHLPDIVVQTPLPGLDMIKAPIKDKRDKRTNRLTSMSQHKSGNKFIFLYEIII